MSEQKPIWVTSVTFSFDNSQPVEICLEDGDLRIIQGDDRVYIEMPAADEFARELLAFIQTAAARGESQ